MMNQENRRIRAAAENLLGGSYQIQQEYNTRGRISSIDRNYVISEDLIAGTRHNGKMSSVRRFFCLLVTFDLLITCLMWLICVVTAGQSLTTAFSEQLIHYRIQTSLFDIAIVAALRFILLLFFYALIYINHWIIVAISTAGTSIFLGAKVYLFDWADEATQPGFEVLLILTSFVIAWAELWHFDCRVVPQETVAKLWTLSTMDSERAPLLRNFLDGPPSRRTESLGNFFTPQDSPTHSEDEDDCRPRFSSVEGAFDSPIPEMPALTPNKIAEYKMKKTSIIDSAYELLLSSDWEILNTTENDDVLSVTTRSYGKVLKIEGIIDARASMLMECLYDCIEDLPKWNDDVIDAKRMQIIDDDTDIVYQSTKPYGGGLIGARDFLTLRSRGKRGNYFIASGISADCNFPIRKNYVRGENDIVCMATEHISSREENGENKCKCIWILSTNLKGWLPQKVIDTALTTTLINFMTPLRLYVKSLPQLSV